MATTTFDVFNGELEDFSTYIERLEQFFIVNETKQELKASFLLTVIGRKAFGILKNLLLPESPSNKTYEQLVTTLNSHFAPVRITVAERFKFYKRSQRSDETISAYLLALKHLSSSCDFGNFLPQALRDAFVCGLSNENIQKRLLSEQQLTLEQASKIAFAMELASKETHSLHDRPSTSTNYVEVKPNHFRPSVDSKRNDSSKYKLFLKHKAQPRSFPTCKRCGKSNHKEESCPAKQWSCFNCGKRGHTSKVCKRNLKEVSLDSMESEIQSSIVPSYQFTPKNRAEQSNSSASSISSEQDIFTLTTVLGVTSNSASLEPLVVELRVEDKILSLEIDTGAAVSLIPTSIYDLQFSEIPIRPTNIKLKSVLGESICVKGEIPVSVQLENQGSYSLTLLVVSGISTPLLGRSWLSVLLPNWRQYFRHWPTSPADCVKALSPKADLKVDPFVEQLRNMYPQVFDDSAEGKIGGYKAHIHIREDAKPIFLKAYPVAYALRSKVEDELQKLQDRQILIPVQHSEWASPIVIVPKANSTNIRLCVDFKKTLNQVVTTDHYPLPRIEDILATLSKGKVFAVIDLSNAYQQLDVSPDSTELLTINTHKGLFQFCRLPFGISCAPAIFQRVMDSVLSGLSHSCCYLDDVLITGQDETELKSNVTMVVQRLAQHNIRINVQKCQFMSHSVEYLGHKISAQGIKPSEKNSEAILEAPSPGNVTQLKSYLGMLNFYAKFIPNLSLQLSPLYRLLQSKTKWAWTEDCETAFRKSKRLLVDHNLLAHFDPEKPIYLTCDASAYGVGAVLSHKDGDREIPILCASSTLNKAERNYAQLEREALALIFGVKRFHKYLWGRKFFLVTDHQPLQFIFNPKKGIPTLAAARIQRWAIILAAYHYDIQYRKGTEIAVADALSRNPVQDEREVSICSFSFRNELPVTATEVASATKQDPTLKNIMDYTLLGWPAALPNPAYKPYWSRKCEITAEQGCLLWGNRVIVPKILQPRVMQELHDSHPGIVRMKMLARSYFWWPGLNSDIDDCVNRCEPCQLHQASPPRTIGKWPTTSKPWERVHLDFARLQELNFLVMADASSRWIDLYLVPAATSEMVIAKLRNSISYFGFPKTIVADNGTPFSSSEFRAFCLNNAIELIHTPTYHPSSNGTAERAIRTIKSSLRKMLMERPDEHPQRIVDDVLLSYRNTPCTVTGQTPAEVIFQYKPRIKLDALKPNKAKRDCQLKPSAQQKNPFPAGERVLVKSTRLGKTRWWPGRILEVKSPLTYMVTVEGRTRFVHRDHLRPFRAPDDNQSVES